MPFTGLECREGDAVTAALLDKLNHQESALRCHAERAFMRSLEGGCSVPLGTHTEVNLQPGGTLKMMGAVYVMIPSACTAAVHRWWPDLDCVCLRRCVLGY